jgi:poly(3-hydroxybutyrate) depolymerase
MVRDPIIPPVSGTCPPFETGTIALMGLADIQIVVGPKAAGPTAPMVFYWHGTGSSANEYETFAPEIRDRAVASGGVLVAFQSSTGGDILSGTAIFGEGDFRITDQLVACAVRDHNVDPRRIYVTGCSAGGLFAAAMAARRSSYVAAAAANAGGWAMPVTWQNNHTPALLAAYPGYQGGPVVIDFRATSKLAGDAFKKRGGFVIDCAHDSTHCARGLGPSFWQFFDAHPFGIAPEPWSMAPPGFIGRCKIY